MSTGEKRCKMYGNCNHFPTAKECSTGCEFYNPRNPKEIVELPDEILEEKADIKLEFSDLSKFDKKHEFFVFKKHVFMAQSISLKKIILKYKRRLKKSDDSLTDGCYIFKNQKGELLEPEKVFKKFDRETAKRKNNA